MQPETKFKMKVQADLREFGKKIWFYKANDKTTRGIPDIIVCLNSYFVSIELKVNRNKPDRLQDHNLTKIATAGGIAMVSYPETWKQDLKLLRKISNLELTSFDLQLEEKDGQS